MLSILQNGFLSQPKESKTITFYGRMTFLRTAEQHDQKHFLIGGNANASAGLSAILNLRDF